MRKTLITVFTLLLLGLNTSAQDIISGASIWDDDIALGDEVEIEFNVNYLTDDDSYSVDFDIDYDFMEITITVDYSYDEDGDKADDYESENISIMPLLEGQYDVTIICDVAFESSLDEEVNLDYISVDPPEDDDCDASFVPSISGFCPWSGEEVCACNGKTYDNECEAYFEEEHGLYYHFTCGDYVEENSVKFKCGHFDLDIDNTFVTYDCSNSDFDGDELYLEYEHSGDSLLIEFDASDSDIRLFLIDIDGGDLDCIEISNNSELQIDNLPSGTYYIIADSDNYGGSIDICDVSSNKDLTKPAKITIYPNPIYSDFFIYSDNKIKNISIKNTFGKELFNGKYNNNTVKVADKIPSGIYFITVNTEKTTITKKIIVD